MCLSSWGRESLSLISYARWPRVRFTEDLMAGWWKDLLWRYQSVWVGLRWTRCWRDPSRFLVRWTSRKDSWPSCSCSIVNLMEGCCLLRSCRNPWGRS